MTEQARPSPDRTVAALRARWQPTKERLVAEDRKEDVRIGVHRPCSWLERVEEIEALDPERAADAVLIFRWIALNSLYGCHEPGRSESASDLDSLRRCVDRALAVDADGRVHAMLEEQRDLVLERIYLVRCQLVHGADTYGGGLNRDAVESCSRMLGELVPAFLLVVIDHGYEEDWGPLPYPPVDLG